MGFVQNATVNEEVALKALNQVTLTPFNINDTVRIKLTTHGKEILRKK